MTEEEWLGCADPGPMMKFLQGKASDRKLRLFAVACCRRIRHLLTNERSLRAVSVAERYADGFASEEERIAANDEALFVVNVEAASAVDEAAAGAAQGAIWWEKGYYGSRGVHLLYLLEKDALNAVLYSGGPNDEKAEEIAQANLLRCIFGNQFRPVAIHPSWRTPTVLSLAQTIYDERQFQNMPILADSLEDAGCTSPDLLAHCRQAGVHVRGCWSLDMILGKE